MVRMLVFHPEGDDFAVAMQGAVDADATVGNLELRDIGRLSRLQSDSRRRDENQNSKEDVVKENARDGDGHGHDAECQIPVAPALDMLVLIRAPVQHRILIGHTR